MKGKDNIYVASVQLRNAYDNALQVIIDVVKANGGLVKTPAASDKPTLHAFFEDFDGLINHQAIHGLRWDEELGLTLCTDDMLDNYQFDNDYTFDYYFDFVERDAEELEKALADPAYFVEFGDYDMVREETIKSIIDGLESYL